MLGIENMQWKKGAQRSQKEHDLLLEYDRCKAIRDKIRTKVNDKIKSGVPSWGLIDPNNPSENDDPPLGNETERTWRNTQVSYYVLKECFRLWWNRLGRYYYDDGEWITSVYGENTEQKEEKRLKALESLKNSRAEDAKKRKRKHLQRIERQKEEVVSAKRDGDKLYKKYAKLADKPVKMLEKLNEEFPAESYTEVTEEDLEIMKKWSKSWKQKMKKTNEQLDQIGMMLFQPETKHMKAYFKGKIRRGTVWEECKTYLRIRWVKWAFKPTFWGMLMSHPVRWMPVPVGAANPNQAPFDLITEVECRYQQEEAEYCLVYSLASALHYIGLEKEASDLAAIVEDTSEVSIDVALQTLIVYMKEKAPIIGLHVAFGALRKKKKKNIPSPNLKAICEEKTIYPTLVVPLGSDGSLNHAVCIVDDLVFDATQAFALRLCKATFNWTVGAAGCNGIHGLCRFERPATKGLTPLHRVMKKNWV